MNAAGKTFSGFLAVSKSEKMEGVIMKKVTVFMLIAGLLFLLCACGNNEQAIAETKMPDLNAASLEAAMSMIAGTARSMGIKVEE